MEYVQQKKTCTFIFYIVGIYILCVHILIVFILPLFTHSFEYNLLQLSPLSFTHACMRTQTHTFGYQFASKSQ